MNYSESDRDISDSSTGSGKQWMSRTNDHKSHSESIDSKRSRS